MILFSFSLSFLVHAYFFFVYMSTGVFKAIESRF